MDTKELQTRLRDGVIEAITPLMLDTIDLAASDTAAHIRDTVVPEITSDEMSGLSEELEAELSTKMEACGWYGATVPIEEILKQMRLTIEARFAERVDSELGW